MMGEALIGLQERTGDPSSMPSGWGRIFFKNDKRLYVIDDTLTVSKVALAGDAPTTHAASHTNGGSDPLSLDADQVVSGTLSLANGGTASNLTGADGILTVGDGSLAVIKSGFSVCLSANQTGISGYTDTKVAFDEEIYDLSNEFDPTLHRLTPGQAGLYLLIAVISFDFGVDNPRIIATIYKNGSPLTGRDGAMKRTAAYDTAAITAIVEGNGSGDYFEIYATHAHGSAATLYRGSSSLVTTWQGAYIGRA